MSENTVRIYCKSAIGPVVRRHCRCADLTLYNERGGTITTALAELQKRACFDLLGLVKGMPVVSASRIAGPTRMGPPKETALRKCGRSVSSLNIKR